MLKYLWRRCLCSSRVAARAAVHGRHAEAAAAGAVRLPAAAAKPEGGQMLVIQTITTSEGVEYDGAGTAGSFSDIYNVSWVGARLRDNGVFAPYICGNHRIKSQLKSIQTFLETGSLTALC